MGEGNPNICVYVSVSGTGAKAVRCEHPTAHELAGIFETLRVYYFSVSFRGSYFSRNFKHPTSRHDTSPMEPASEVPHGGWSRMGLDLGALKMYHPHTHGHPTS